MSTDIGQVTEHKAVTTANKWLIAGADCKLLWHELEGDWNGANSNVAQSFLCHPGLNATFKLDSFVAINIEIHRSETEDVLTPLLQL